MEVNMQNVKTAIENAIADFEKRKLIFFNERQFQVELTVFLRGVFGYGVCPEVRTQIASEKETERKKKRYTDIAVFSDGGEFVAIELKYKTKGAKYGSIELLNQGAQSLGRYNFIKDVSRIEELKKDVCIEKQLKGKCLGGFALFLTNDERYYGQAVRDRVYGEFRLENGGVLTGNKKVNVDGKNDCVEIKGKYKLVWKPYNVEKDFKYLFLEI